MLICSVEYDDVDVLMFGWYVECWIFSDILFFNKVVFVRFMVELYDYEIDCIVEFFLNFDEFFNVLVCLCWEWIWKVGKIFCCICCIWN